MRVWLVALAASLLCLVAGQTGCIDPVVCLVRINAAQPAVCDTSLAAFQVNASSTSCGFCGAWFASVNNGPLFAPNTCHNGLLNFTFLTTSPGLYTLDAVYVPTVGNSTWVKPSGGLVVSNCSVCASPPCGNTAAAASGKGGLNFVFQ